MRRKSGYLTAMIVILGLLVACAPGATASPISMPAPLEPTEEPADIAQPPIHLKVGVLNFISFAPLFIAHEEGYFAEQGLDVELVDFGSTSNEIVPALVARELDVAGPPLSAAVFNAILQGNNLKYVADKGFINPDNCASDAWVGSKSDLDSGALSDPSSIRGRNVVFPAGGTFEYSMDILLGQSQLTQNDINVSSIADSAARIEGLKNGSVDVSLLSEPWITRAQAAGAGDIWIPFSEILPNLSLGTIAFGPGILEDKPEAGTRFMIAYLKAIEQFNEGKTERNIELIATFTKQSPEDIKASCWTSFRPDGSIDTESILTFQDWAVEKGYTDGTLELDQFWTSQFVDEAGEKIKQ